MGAKKKLVARISKSEPLILKSKPLIFCPLKTRPAGAGDQWPFGRISVCLRVPKMRTNKAWTVAAVPGGRRGVDYRGYVVAQFKHRALDLPHELEEGCHDAEGHGWFQQ